MNKIFGGAQMLVLAATLSLVGCGQSSIKNVKSSYIDEANTTTVAQLLDNRKACESTEWSELEDDKKRVVVDYQCQLVAEEDYLANKRASFVESSKSILMRELNNYKSQIKQHEEYLQTDSGQESAVSSGNVDEADGELANLSQKLIAIANFEKDIKGLIDSYNEERFVELVLRDEVGVVGGGYPVLRDTLRSHVALLKIQPRDQRLDYKKRNIDSRVERLRAELPNIRSLAQKELAEVELKLQSEKAARETYRLNQVERQKQFREEGVKAAQDGIEDMKKYISRTELKLSDGQIEKEAAIKFPVYEKVVERFQWIVNAEGLPTIVYGDVVAFKKDGKSTELVRYSDPSRIFSIIARSKAVNYFEYMGEVSPLGFGGLAVH